MKTRALHPLFTGFSQIDYLAGSETATQSDVVIAEREMHLQPDASGIGVSLNDTGTMAAKLDGWRGLVSCKSSAPRGPRLLCALELLREDAFAELSTEPLAHDRQVMHSQVTSVGRQHVKRTEFR